MKHLPFIFLILILWGGTFGLMRALSPKNHFVDIKIPKFNPPTKPIQSFNLNRMKELTHFKLVNPWIKINPETSLLQTEITQAVYTDFLNYLNDASTKLPRPPDFLEIPSDDQLSLMGIHKKDDGTFALVNPSNGNLPISYINWFQANFFCKNLCYTCQLPSEHDFEQAGQTNENCELALPSEYCKMSVYVDTQIKELANFSIRDEHVLIKKTEKKITYKSTANDSLASESHDDVADVENEDSESIDDTENTDDSNLEDEGTDSPIVSYQTLIMNDTEWINYSISIASYPPNSLGFYDLSGNVTEWTRDWENSQEINKVSKGGSWYQSSKNIYIKARQVHSPFIYVPYLGFRCSRNVTLLDRKEK